MIAAPWRQESSAACLLWISDLWNMSSHCRCLPASDTALQSGFCGKVCVGFFRSTYGPIGQKPVLTPLSLIGSMAPYVSGLATSGIRPNSPRQRRCATNCCHIPYLIARIRQTNGRSGQFFISHLNCGAGRFARTAAQICSRKTWPFNVPSLRHHPGLQCGHHGAASGGVCCRPARGGGNPAYR